MSSSRYSQRVYESSHEPHSRSRGSSDHFSRRSSRRSTEEVFKSSTGATILGAVTGGLLARKMTKGDNLATLAGVVMGALGAREADFHGKRR